MAIPNYIKLILIKASLTKKCKFLLSFVGERWLLKNLRRVSQIKINVMKKLITNAMSKKLSRNEMKAISGGRFALEDDCGSGTFSCSCNGTDYGCVSSVQECWNKC